MTKDLDDLLEEKQQELFDEDEEDDSGLDPFLWMLIQHILAILLLIAVIAIFLHFHGDKIAPFLDQLKEMMDALQNPTGFTPQQLI